MQTFLKENLRVDGNGQLYASIIRTAVSEGDFQRCELADDGRTFIENPRWTEFCDWHVSRARKDFCGIRGMSIDRIVFLRQDESVSPIWPYNARDFEYRVFFNVEDVDTTQLNVLHVRCTLMRTDTLMPPGWVGFDAVRLREDSEHWWCFEPI